MAANGPAFAVSVHDEGVHLHVGNGNRVVLTRSEARRLARTLRRAARAPEQPRTPVNLPEAAYRIAFEMFHLQYYTDLWVNSPGEGRLRTRFGERLGTAFEYSIFLHLRVVLEFFYNRHPKDDDVWVGDFRRDPTFAQAFPEALSDPSPSADEIRARLNKWFAHFTRSRIEQQHDHQGLGHYRPCWEQVLVLIDTFHSALSGASLERFNERMKQFHHNRDEHLYLRRRRKVNPSTPSPLSPRRLAAGLAERTLRNLEYMQAAHDDGEEVHVVTEMVNSLLALLVFPVLGGHLKTGHTWTLQNRPTEQDRNKIFIP
jgi:hypothetical protein